HLSPLSLHDALPIFPHGRGPVLTRAPAPHAGVMWGSGPPSGGSSEGGAAPSPSGGRTGGRWSRTTRENRQGTTSRVVTRPASSRSEEHTSELQSRSE